jgi:hypothetical protein
MKDIAITIDLAARWLNCPPSTVEEYMATGRLKPFQGKDAGRDAPISLNSVVILAESLPVENRIFHVSEGAGDRGGDRPRPSGPRPGYDRGAQEQRPPVIVERRTPRVILNRG